MLGGIIVLLDRCVAGDVDGSEDAGVCTKGGDGSCGMSAVLLEIEG